MLRLPRGPGLPRAIVLRFALLLGIGSASLGATNAAAAQFVISFHGTVFAATLELGAVLGNGDPISGTIVLDDAVAGAFTPAADPVFLRNEMTYAGAVVSTQLSILGDALGGTGGRVDLFDAAGELAGSDSYEVTSDLDSGTVSGVAPASLAFVKESTFPAFTLADGDPLLPPPPYEINTFNGFTLTAESGAVAFGNIDGFEVLPVPEPSSLSVVLAGLAITALHANRSRRRSPGRGAGARPTSLFSRE